MTANYTGGARTKVVERITVPWTSDAAGAYTEEITIDGQLVRLVTDPGTPAPTDNYDVTLPDDHGLDLLGGGGANRDTANTEGVNLAAAASGTDNPIFYSGKATVTIANAGDSKAGTVYLYVLNYGAS